MHGGHQALSDAPVVIQHLGDGGQAGGGTGGVGHEVHVSGVLVQVDAAHEHGRVILGGGGHDDLLGTGIQVSLGLLLRQEQTGGLHHILRAQLGPGQVGGVPLGGDGDLLAVDHDGVLSAADLSLADAVHGVILQHIGQILGRAQVVDAHDLDLGVVQAGPKDHAANAAKAIDANFNAHCNCLLYQVLVALHYYIPFFLILVVCVLHSFFSVSPWKLATSGHRRPCLLFFFPMDLHSSPESAPMFLLMQQISDILGPVRAGLTPRPSEIFHF